MIIAITGTPGSGKSTIAKKLVKELGFERVYAGGMVRKLAKDMGMTVEGLMAYAKTHPEIDIKIDKNVAKMAKEWAGAGKSVIAEGRIQPFLIQESIKIFIKVSPEEGARRIFGDLQDEEKKKARNEDIVDSIDAVKEKMMFRHHDDAKRLEGLYGFNYLNESKYDLVLDTTTISADEATEKVKEFLSTLKKSN